MDFSTKTDDDIEVWIRNYEAKPGATALPFYRELLEERARRAQTKQRLNLERSLAYLKQVAIEQRCTSYGELAKASGVEWAQARRQMSGWGGHLDRLLDLCHARRLPLLTAVCVNQDRVAECELADEALAGFVAGARRLGFAVTDARAFHHQCRAECWRWGREQAGQAQAAG
jgi:hypothetical protein